MKGRYVFGPAVAFVATFASSRFHGLVRSAIRRFAFYLNFQFCFLASSTLGLTAARPLFMIPRGAGAPLRGSLEVEGMSIRPKMYGGSTDPVLIAAVAVAAVLAPTQAFAAQVGCFVTAVLLGMMFVLGIGITSLMKYLLARYLWQVDRTPWVRLFGITWLELVLGISFFAAIRSSFWLTVVIYLPFAALLNGWLLSGVRGSGGVSILRRYGGLFLFPLSLPVSIQIAGVIWSAVTSMLTFTDLRV